MSKTLGKYIAAFGYFDKTYWFYQQQVIVFLLLIANRASFSLVFSFSNGFAKKKF